MPELVVASFNVRNGRAWDGWDSWPFRRASTAAAIDALGADLVGLQEVYGFQLRYLLRRLAGRDAVGGGRTDGAGRGERCTVLARPPAVRVDAARTRWFGPTPERPGTRLPGARFPRVATVCDCTTDTGARLQFVNTHLDAASPSRRRDSARQLLTWLDLARPVVVVGDFNAERDDPLFRTLEAGGLRLALGAGSGGTNHDFTGAPDGRAIDHILLNEAVDVVEARVVHERVGRRLPSDHWPVRATVAF